MKHLAPVQTWSFCSILHILGKKEDKSSQWETGKVKSVKTKPEARATRFKNALFLNITVVCDGKR